MTGTTAEPIRNLNLVTVAWNDISFHCTAKSLPSVKDAPTWTILTDNTDEVTGRTIVGKPLGLEPIELTIETDVSLVYGALMTAFAEGTQSDATFTYTPRGSQAALTVTVPKCTICGLSTSGGNNNGHATTTVKLQPEGGELEDMPAQAAG